MPGFGRQVEVGGLFCDDPIFFVSGADGLEVAMN